ncbi:aminotransferase class V-fold PLP-dependent enzyme [Xenorhabdus sp. PR6a]|uniref:DegT/DnrJ/EryC1/StrS family aminotransferase n=1 Tax=Xenorhabdus sp. PR6a TaxID=3025877 RepID=UPI00235851FA|nr:aminotransferase class V-fold PLP-dependent enzyme [Xenorhabdus sp. PR6a]MDC9582844.1 aminotransferase class V-fold PLP-dependent enzyme [Xenorhabdus sp. PR6a]
MNSNYSKFSHPKISDEIKSSVQSQLLEDISIYDNGGIYERLEGEFKKKFSVENAIAVNSGTTALFSMFYGAGISKGDEVIVPGYTFFATCAPLHQLGAELKFADCGDNGNVDPKAVEALITTKTKAVVITHMWGIPCDMDELMDICIRHNLLLLEDSSHAHGATWDGKMIGSFSDGSAWSFQGKKILTSGEGGFFATKHRRMYERAVLVGHFNKRAKKEVHNEDLKDFAITGTGLNLRMHPLGAAVVMPQMAHFDQMMKEKRETALLMKKGIEAIDGLKVVRIPEKADPAWYVLPVMFDENKFTVGLHKFVEKLNELGAVEADIPGSTCPLNGYFLFHSPHKISQDYAEKVRVEKKNFENGIKFHNSMFKLDVWYGEERFNFIDNYLSIINSVAELYRK